MTTLTLAPEVLRWAAGNIGSTVEQLALRVTTAKKVERLAAGHLTAKQAEKFANLARVPFGYLFLSEPPVLERAQLPDLRQLPNATALSSSFYDALDDVLRKQEWYANYLEEVDANIPECVGKYDHNTQVSVVAASVARSIGCDEALRRRCATKEEYFAELVKGVERSGILVFKNGVVRNNIHRPLNVDEFRGFAVSHRRAPAVFINGKDAAAAWIFTLIHEVAHIWFGESGVSDFSATVAERPRGLELKCNQVAAEVLTPTAEFMQAWKNHAHAVPLVQLPRLFKVSRLVIAKRALDLGLIQRQEYVEALERTRKSEADAEGGDYYKSVVVRNSKSFTRAVVNEAFAGRVLLRDAGSLLNVAPNAVAELRNRGVGDFA